MINKQYDAQAKAWLAENKEKILDMWMALIRIPSVQSAPMPNAPFGPACAQMLKTAEAMLEELGVQVQCNEADGYLYADYGTAERSIGIFAHGDVVPVGDGWLFTEPFVPVVKDGVLIGRGSADNKNGIVAAWCAVAMLKELGIPLRNRLRVFVGSNEESGMKDIEAYVAKEEMPTLSLVPDSSFPCGLGEKGILRTWLQSDRPLAAVRQMRGGDAFNIVLDRVDTVLAPNAALERELAEKCAGDDRYALSVAEDGCILLRANGVAKHAAHPDGSLNATWLTASLLAACEAMPAEDREILAVVADYLQDHNGAALGIAHTDANFGDLSCANGMVDMEKGCLKLSLDIRYGTTLDPNVLEEKLFSAWEKRGFCRVYLENRAGYTVDITSPVPHALKAVAEELAGCEKNFYWMRGGTYGRYLKNAFVVGTGIRPVDQPAPALEMPIGRGGAHQRDEAADIDAVLTGIRVLLHDVLACDELIG